MTHSDYVSGGTDKHILKSAQQLFTGLVDTPLCKPSKQANKQTNKQQMDTDRQTISGEVISNYAKWLLTLGYFRGNLNTGVVTFQGSRLDRVPEYTT